MYAEGLGPESLPTNCHNWLHNTSDSIIDTNLSENDLIDNIKRRTKKHIATHKHKINKGYNSWRPK